MGDRAAARRAAVPPSASHYLYPLFVIGGAAAGAGGETGIREGEDAPSAGGERGGGSHGDGVSGGDHLRVLSRSVRRVREWRGGETRRALGSSRRVRRGATTSSIFWHMQKQSAIFVIQETHRRIVSEKQKRKKESRWVPERKRRRGELRVEFPRQRRAAGGGSNRAG